MNEKKLKHIRVYDRLYEMIQNGTYSEGCQLPSETALSAELGVSRMTLRKALTLLQDDGLTRNVHGVGHFVCGSVKKEAPSSAETDNPVYSYCTDIIGNIKFDFRIEPPTPAITDSLERYTAAVVIADSWYAGENGMTAYSLSIIPIETVAENHIDLNDSQQLMEYIHSGCYNNYSRCKRILTHSSAGNFSSKDYSLSDRDSFLLIQETIYDGDGKITVSNKHYIPSEKFRITIDL